MPRTEPYSSFALLILSQSYNLLFLIARESVFFASWRLCERNIAVSGQALGKERELGVEALRESIISLNNPQIFLKSQRDVS